MNILYIALLLCVVYRAFASESGVPDVDKQVVPLEVVSEDDITKSPEVQKFVGAVQRGDTLFAWNIFNAGNDKLKDYCGKHLANLEKARLFELINIAEDCLKPWMLGVTLIYSGKTLFNEVSSKIEPTTFTLALVANNNADLVCNTGKFFYLLGKMTVKKYQEFTVGLGAIALVKANKLEHFDPLLSALEDEPSLGPSMTNVAILEAFMASSTYTDDRIFIVKNFFDHPAVFAKYYSIALYASYMSEDPEHELFYWLLAQADRQDLEQVKSESEELFSKMSVEFQEAVNKALEAVGPDARIGIRRRRIEPILTDLLPKDLFGIIFGYVSVDLAMPKVSGGAASANVPLPKKKPETSHKAASIPTNHGAFDSFHAY